MKKCSIEKALALGIKYYDTAASYGPLEEGFNQVLPTYRERIYLNTFKFNSWGTPIQEA